MKFNPLRPGSCLWVIGLFAWPALLNAGCDTCDSLVLDLSFLAPAAATIESDEPPAVRAPVRTMEPERPFDEGFTIGVE